MKNRSGVLSDGCEIPEASDAKLRNGASLESQESMQASAISVYPDREKQINILVKD